jgi:GABA permease
MKPPGRDSGSVHLRGRARLERDRPEALSVRMWGFPYLSVLVLVVLLAVFGGMIFDSGSRHSMMLTLVVTGVAVAAGILHQRSRGAATPAEAPEAADTASAP